MSAEPPSPGTAPQLRVTVEDRQSFVVLEPSRWAQLAARALTHEGVGSNAEVGLAFVEVAEMTKLNVDYMGGSGPTDVLAFPIDGWSKPEPGHAAPPLAPAPGVPPAMIGDIVVCPEIAERSTSATQSIADELALLIVHGALHLIGHDHYEADERERMQAREQVLLAAFHQADARS